jgi:hypothetical protein
MRSTHTLRRRKERKKRETYAYAILLYLITIFHSPLVSMGLLSQGRPLTWTEIKVALEPIRTYGVDQLIHVYNKFKDRQKDAFTWGDEVLYYSRKFLYLVLSFSRSN